MIFAKFRSESEIIMCPRSGYVGRKAVSNLAKYFEKHPETAASEGYCEFVPLGEQVSEDAGVYYEAAEGKIYERKVAV